MLPGRARPCIPGAVLGFAPWIDCQSESGSRSRESRHSASGKAVCWGLWGAVRHDPAPGQTRLLCSWSSLKQSKAKQSQPFSQGSSLTGLFAETSFLPKVRQALESHSAGNPSEKAVSLPCGQRACFRLDDGGMFSSPGQARVLSSISKDAHRLSCVMDLPC